MKIKVWDPFVRLFHWTTASAFFVNYWLIEDGPVHEWIGYGVAGLVTARLVWGVIGSPHARFSSFLPTPHRVFGHLRALRAGEHPVYVGHNPLGALMILALLSLLSALSLTGWMMGLDIFWGVDWVEESHELLATLTQVLVGIHITAVLFADLTGKEGLVRAMLNGHKQVPEQAPVMLENRTL